VNQKSSTKLFGEKMYRRKVAIRMQKEGKKKEIWQMVYRSLLGHRKNLASVNLYRIEGNAENGQTVVVCGKVLGKGEIRKKLTIVALSCSQSALDKIKSSGGQFIPFEQFEDFGNKNIVVLK